MMFERIYDELDYIVKTHKLDDNLRQKIFEYFAFCWQKNLIFDKELIDFSELNSTLQS